MTYTEFQLNPSCPFNLDSTLSCGQAFRWEKRGEWWYGVVEERVLKIRQVGATLEFENVDADFVESYFRLDDDLPTIYSRIGKDEYIGKAVRKFKGLRILRQNPWECLISYICATYKNIPAIMQTLFKLSRKFGNEAKLDSYSFYTFPTPTKLANVSIKELRECGLGYRAKYISKTARDIYESDFELESLKRISYKKARQTLLNFYGVGLKVADCISLFSLEKLEAFPVDVWMKRVVIRHYADHFERKFIRKISSQKSFTRSEYERLSLFGRRYFGEYAGYAQEYLYHYKRTQRLDR